MCVRDEERETLNGIFTMKKSIKEHHTNQKSSVYFKEVSSVQGI